MQSHEIDQALEVINTAWSSGKPLAPMAAAVWGAELRKHKLDDVMRVLLALVRTSKWRPSLAEIIEPLAPASQVKSAFEAFETVWGQIGKRPRVVSELELRAVRRLGGWSVLGNWQISERHWHLKAFREAYDDIIESEASTQLRAVAGGQQRALVGGA